MQIDIRDGSYWRRYVPFWNPDSEAPFREIVHHQFRAATGQGERRVKCMLSSIELSVLFALAKDYWTGEGEIIDLGCLYGLTTRCFGDGVRLNATVPDAEKSERIFAYDLFLIDDYDWWMEPSTGVSAGSCFSDFMKLNRDNLDLIVPCPGDLTRMRWGKKPIELLMIDASKSWGLNHWIVSRMFPRLIPGKSIVIQQDYCHFAEYWCAITMEYFQDRFEPLDFVYGASGLFLCRAPITDEEAAFDLASLDGKTKCALIEAAIDKAPKSAKEVVKTGYAKLLLDLGERQKAIRMLEDVTCARMTDDVARDFSEIARSCVKSVRALIEA